MEFIFLECVERIVMQEKYFRSEQHLCALAQIVHISATRSPLRFDLSVFFFFFAMMVVQNLAWISVSRTGGAWATSGPSYNLNCPVKYYFKFISTCLSVEDTGLVSF